MSQIDINPLAEGDRNHAFRLAYRAYPRLMDELDNPSLRIDLSLAAFLQNRAEDDGVRRFRGGAFSGNYAVSTALHVRYPHVGQGESTSVVHAPKIRLSETVDAAIGAPGRGGAGVWHDGMDARQAALAVADMLEALYIARRRADAAAPTANPARRPARHRQRDGEELQRQRRRAFTAGANRRRAAVA